MNLFFRLLLVFFAALRSKQRVSILTETNLNFRVWLTDQDMFMHMTNSRYLSFSDLGTINYIVRTGTWDVLRKRGWQPIICAQTMVISRMLTTPQRFELRSRITGWTDKYVGLCHTFHVRGRKHAEVRVIARFASRDKTRVEPQAMIDALGETVTSPPLDQSYLDLIDELERARALERQKA